MNDVLKADSSSKTHCIQEVQHDLKRLQFLKQTSHKNTFQILAQVLINLSFVSLNFMSEKVNTLVDHVEYSETRLNSMEKNQAIRLDE
jgi:hypothetical protein